jgi:hypothetical protein
LRNNIRKIIGTIVTIPKVIILILKTVGATGNKLNQHHPVKFCYVAAYSFFPFLDDMTVQENFVSGWLFDLDD